MTVQNSENTKMRSNIGPVIRYSIKIELHPDTPSQLTWIYWPLYTPPKNQPTAGEQKPDDRVRLGGENTRGKIYTAKMAFP